MSGASDNKAPLDRKARLVRLKWKRAKAGLSFNYIHTPSYEIAKSMPHTDSDFEIEPLGIEAFDDIIPKGDGE